MYTKHARDKKKHHTGHSEETEEKKKKLWTTNNHMFYETTNDIQVKTDRTGKKTELGFVVWVSAWWFGNGKFNGHQHNSVSGLFF